MTRVLSIFIILSLFTPLLDLKIFAAVEDTTSTNTPTPLRLQKPLELHPLEKDKTTIPGQLDNQLTEEYRKLKDTYLRSVDTYKQGRQDFMKVQEETEKMRSPENIEKLLESAKRHLKNSLEALIRHLEVLKVRVGNVPGMNEGLKNTLLSEIDNDISYLQSQLGSIDELNSLDEIRSLGKAAKEYELKVRWHNKKIVGHILAARFRHFLDRLKSLSEKLQADVAELESAGADVIDIKALLENFDKNIALAEEKYSEAVVIFQSISSVGEAQELFTKGHNLIKDGHNYLKSAHADLRQAVSLIKKLQSS